MVTHFIVNTRLGLFHEEQVAIKKLKESRNSEKDLMEFRSEGMIMKAAAHPRIILCYGIVDGVGQQAMVLELMANNSLASLIEAPNSVLAWNVRYQIALDIALGMEYLHRLRFVHRDLKCANVLLDHYFRAKIADF